MQNGGGYKNKTEAHPFCGTRLRFYLTINFLEVVVETELQTRVE